MQDKIVYVCTAHRQRPDCGGAFYASKAPYHFTAEEINLMTLIGNHIGVAIEMLSCWRW